MADLSRYLPLSNRPAEDETGVTGDRRAELAEVVRLAAALDGGAYFLADARLDAEFAGQELVAVAAAIEGGGRRGIRALSDAVRALLRLAGDREIDLDPITSGAVALYAVTRTSHDRRAVVGGCTLQATDAGWEFGHGPLRAAPARQIVAFLLGVADVPPPLSSRR